MELLRCYSIVASRLPNPFPDDTYTSMLDSYIHYCVPAMMKSKKLSTLINHVGFTDDVTFGASETSDNLQCYQLAKSPTATDWTAPYFKDEDTAIILRHLLSDAKAPWSISALANIHPEYCSHLKCSRFQILHDKLILIKPVFQDKIFMGLIVVPTGLRRLIFSHYHCGPSGGHMEEYKSFSEFACGFTGQGFEKM